ncbi:hypothetical protein ACLIA0_14825 [Bacillaceae bacterium W0354]
MKELVKTISTPKVYMVDTNVFRYYAYKIGDQTGEAEVIRKQYKEDAKSFFKKAIDETDNKKALIMVSEETKHELIVQSYTLQKESKTYKRLLNNFLVEETEVPKSLEFMLREFSNYIRGKYNGKLVSEGVKTDYLQASDARILAHAYLNDAILVTANTKDFFFYPLLFDQMEDDVLYNISSKQFQKLLPTAKNLLEMDDKFINLLSEMQKFKSH